MSAIEAGTCPCGREMIQQAAWKAAPAIQRAAWLAEHKTILQGRGLCRACYLRTRRAGHIPPRAPKAASPTCCERCGIKTSKTLCRDCADVLDGAA